MGHTDIWEKCIPGREKSKNKGPDLGVSWMSWRKSNKGNVVGIERREERVIDKVKMWGVELWWAL